MKPLRKLEEILGWGGTKKDILFLVVSTVSLILSFATPDILPFNPAWIAIVLCGLPIVFGAIIGLVTEFDIKADVLVSIALVASVVIGEIFAAGEVAFIMAIGAFLEEQTVAKARAGIERLVHLTPTTARVVRDGEECIVPASEVRLGDTLRVFAGETIAVDGVIAKGKTSVDQSVMTGESLPVDKEEGDTVSSGTVNQFGTFDMVAEKVGEDSSLQRMIRLVDSADAGKAKIVGIADRWATWIVVIALASAIVTWLTTGEVIRSVTILVVFCPCALVLATPTAIMAGIGNATKYGILVREGDALERLAKVKCVAFDKTGTLTYGCPSVVRVRSVVPDFEDNAILELAATAELRSEHPLGKAVVAHYKRETGTIPTQPDTFLLMAGRGVSARADGKEIVAGNEALMNDKGVAIPASLAEDAEEARSIGCTVIFLAVNGKATGMVALSDTLRPDAADTVKAIEMRTVLLTGDTAQAAKYMAHHVGITDLKPNCLPEDKLAVIREIQQEGKPVCMVGDGINDAAALKAAHVGIAMGGIGSDIAIDAADIALVGDNINDIPHLLKLAKKTMRTIVINLSGSMLLNFAAIGLAISGVLTPVVGALVHNVGSVVVIINSSLLLKWKDSK